MALGRGGGLSLRLRGIAARCSMATAARSLQSLTTPIFGGTKEGVDPDGQYLKDRAMLETYNRQLGVKQCKTFDLDAELAIKSTDVTPTPR